MIIESSGQVLAMSWTIRDRLNAEHGDDLRSYVPDVTEVELMDRLKVAKSLISAGKSLQATGVIDALFDELASRRSRR